jgi:hypothetical protein
MKRSMKVNLKLGLLAAVLAMVVNVPSLSGQTQIAHSNINKINTQLFALSDNSLSPCFIGYNSDSGAYQLGTINLQSNGINQPVSSTGLSNPPSANGFTQITHFPPFNLGSATYFVVYDSATGFLQLDKVSGSSPSTPCNTLTNTLTSTGPGPLGKDLTHIMPVQMNNETFLMTYSSSTGAVQFFQITGQATGLAPAGSVAWEPGFTHLMPYVLNGTPRFLAYNANNGVVQFQSITSLNSISTDFTTNWGTNLTHFVPNHSSPNATAPFLAYSSLTGAATYNSINPDNKGFSQGPLLTGLLAPGATLFTPFFYSGSNGGSTVTELCGFLAYFPADGLTQVWIY